MVKVSIIVPVYNVYDYLRKCLDSLVKQTLKDIEIIVVNDGSPDNSQEIIDEYVSKYKNVKSFIKKNGGLSDARNYGLKKAVGEYIAFVDSDDYVDKDMMKKMYNKAINDDLDIVVCDNIEVYDYKKVYINSNLHYSDNNVCNYIISPPMACVRLYNRELFDNVKFTKDIYYEDLNLTPSLAIMTNKIGFLEEGLYYYVQRSGSIMKQVKYNEKLLDIFKVLDHNRDILGEKYPDEIEYLYITHLLRTATLRFLDYDNREELLKMVNDEMKYNYPNYKKNKYYKKSSIKLKLICNLSYYKMYGILKLIKRVSGK